MRGTAAIVCLVLSIALAGCATPVRTMKHPETGQMKTCGGDKSSSVAAGLVGYGLQKKNDEQCVELLESLGFEETTEQ